jgi:ABC-type Na+ efflux pump permease subunit
LELIKENTKASAFSVPAISLALLAMCLGFLFYCVLAGMVGAVLYKAEDVSNGMAIFQLPVMASFFMAYFIPLQTKGSIVSFIRYFPFTAPFSVPADLVIGNMGIAQGGISLVILSITTLLLIMLTGKLYKGLILFNGNKLSAKNIIQLLKMK